MITCGMSSRLIQVTSVPAGIVSSIGPKLKLSMVTAFVAGFSWAAVTEGLPIAPLTNTSERARTAPAFIEQKARVVRSSFLFQNLMGISLFLKCGIQGERFQNAALQETKSARTGPGHAFQKAPTIDAVLIQILLNVFCHFALRM